MKTYRLWCGEAEVLQRRKRGGQSVSKAAVGMFVFYNDVFLLHVQ